DQDGDGFHPDDPPYGPTQYVADSGALPGGDCDDTEPTTFPGAPDAFYDGIDSACDGGDDFDQDGDGYDDPSGGGDDCDDLDAAGPWAANTSDPSYDLGAGEAFLVDAGDVYGALALTNGSARILEVVRYAIATATRDSVSYQSTGGSAFTGVGLSIHAGTAYA